MKIAVLSFYGRPKRFISSNRIYGLIRGLSKLGAEVHFFTMPTLLPPDECFDVSLMCKNVVEFSAFPIPLPLYEIGRRLAQQFVVKPLLSEVPEGIREKRPKLGSPLQRFWNWRYASPIFRDNLHTTGFLVLKGVTARRVFKYILENNIQVLFTSHAPPMAHEFGLYCKKRMGPLLYWIADFRDPMFNEYGMCSYSKHLAGLQRDTLTTANLITMVSHSMIQDALEFAQDEGIEVQNRKFYCLYNGFFELPIPPSGNLGSGSFGQKLRISYTGTIFQQKQDISVLFNAFSDLDEEERSLIEFVYAGPQIDLARELIGKYQLQSLCHIVGMVPKEAALQIQRSSDILLLLKSDADRGVFTGKFFEYLFSDRPILVVGDRDAEFNEVAMRVGGVKIVPNGPEGARQIVKILKNILRGPRFPEAVEAEFGKRRPEEVDKFHWDFLSKCLYERIVSELDFGQTGIVRC